MSDPSRFLESKILRFPLWERIFGKIFVKGSHMKPHHQFFLITGILAAAAFPTDFSRADEFADSAPATNERNHDESWYWGLNLGGGKISYQDPVQASVDGTSAVPGTDHATVYFDFYFVGPLQDRKTAMGVSFGGIGDAFSNDARATKRSLMTSMLAFTTHHYFNSNIGDGLFGRADVGLASASETSETAGVERDSDPARGLGVRLGVGYSILLSNETRLPVLIQWQHASIENHSGSNALVFTAGLMF
jgi:hypothetical protein